MNKPKTAMAISNPFNACSDQDNDGTTTAASAGSYTSLGEDPEDGRVAPNQGPTMKPKLAVVFGVLMLLIMAALLATIGMVSRRDPSEAVAPLLPRGVSEGVSAKSRGPHLGVPSFPWTKRMLDWQRTSFHFQPEKNWMNDPNGPLYYKGWYHFFYQYNPEGPIWGNIIWGHAVSRDLIHWRHLPVALTMDKWYDINGVWTGSTTILPDGQVIVLYTGATNETAQVQNLAYPRDLSDPLLIDWVKYSGNPVIVPPPGVGDRDFRDPTTAWLTSGGKWRITIGSKVNKTGLALVYETKDFKKFDLLDGVLHAVQGTGMWECVDFYPVSETEERGLDTSSKGADVKHVVKTSLDDDRHDYYSIGTYDEDSDKWFPDEAKIDVGIGLRYDYGPLYASKTFYDQNKQRRVLWGWIPETDSERADIKKGWASVQAVPRTILLDKRTGSNLLQWPVKEVENLRSKKWEFNKVEIKPGSTVPLDVGATSQLDISAEFEIEKEALERINESDMVCNCSHTGGTAVRGALGPFGVIVLAHNSLSEQTPVYFYVTKGNDGNLKTFFCIDKSRSSEATDVQKSIYGSTVTVLKDEKFFMRVLVDHSIVESFGQGGRTCITSRVYPTKAIYGDAKVFLFNNATEANVTASLKIWQLDSAYIHSYPTELIMFIALCWLLAILCWFFVRPNIPCSILIFC